MDKIWDWSIIKYRQKWALAPMDIHGDNAPVLSTAQKWVAEFKGGRESPEDDPSSGRPARALTMCTTW